jgi:hypothetical protein
MTTTSEGQIIRYLLDEVSEQERASLEEELVRDSSLFDLISAVEDDLIMQYVSGKLDAALMPRFTEVYLHSPAKLARVESARALQLAVRETAAGTSGAQKSKTSILSFFAQASRLRLALVASAVVVVIAISWSIRKTVPASGTYPPERASLISFSLEPGLQRSNSGIQITVPPHVAEIQFELVLANAPTNSNYSVVLDTPEQPDLWSGEVLRKGKDLITTVPAGKLGAGDYTLRLRAYGAGNNWEDVAIYYFRIAR